MVGANLGSEQVGKTDLQAQEIIQQDVDLHQKSTDWSVSGGMNSAYTPGQEPKLGGKAETSYGRSNIRQKLKSNVGGGKAPISYLNTKCEVKIDSQMVELAYELAIDPGKVMNEVVEDSKAIYTAAEDMTIAAVNSFKHPKGVKGTLKDFQNVFVDLGTITSLAQDKEHAKKINSATILNEQELEATVDAQFDYQQERGGVPAKKRASVHLYQGDNQDFEEGSAQNLRNYKGGYDTKNNKVYVNTSKTDISSGSDIQKVLFTEQQRKETNDSSWLNKLNKEQQRNLAYDRGNRAAKNWDRFGNPSTKSNPVAVNSWNERHKTSMASNNAWISQTDGSKVKPRVLEKFDKRYWAALKRGDNEEAAQIKAFYGDIEDRIPLVGPGVLLYENIEDGDYVEAFYNAKILGRQVIGVIRSRGLSLLGEAGYAFRGYAIDQVQNFFNHGGERNGPHANKDRKEAAKGKLEEAEEKLQKYERESLGDKDRKKELRKLNRQKKHHQRGKDNTGETHSRKPKGNRGRRR